MKNLALAPSIALLVGSASTATATSISYNLPFTNACYEAAQVRDTTGRGLSQCNAAIIREATSVEERSATLVNRGILLLVKRDGAAAERDFDEALSIDPTQPEAWLGKAIESQTAGDGAQAVTFATRALQFGARRPAVAYLVRGLANEQQGRLSAAYADLQTARQLEPNWAEPGAQLSRYKVVQN
jgi:tetratricopeptide (TPR) repeat protein